MKSIVFAFAIFAIAAADVSHLSSRYLPPVSNGDKPAEGHTTTTIEKQELQELPEQIEYVQPPQMDAQAMPQMDTPIEEMQSPPAPKYLPPAPTQQQEQEQKLEQQPDQQQPEQQQPEAEEKPVPEMMPSQEFLAPVEQQPMPAQEYLEPESEMPRMTPAGQYLPPAPMPEMAQPTYQQYQDQLLREQEMQMQMQMMMMAQSMPDIEQQQMMEVMPSTAAEIIAPEQLAVEPAHILAKDGYHYKNGAEDTTRFRLRN